jgi:hypothetical protein
VPEWIVTDEWYDGCFHEMKSVEPDTYRFVMQRLRDYVPVYRSVSMVVWSRNRPDRPKPMNVSLP